MKFFGNDFVFAQIKVGNKKIDENYFILSRSIYILWEWLNSLIEKQIQEEDYSLFNYMYLNFSSFKNCCFPQKNQQ